jgi:hypothetical protein
MRVFNLAEELEKERKKNKELEKIAEERMNTILKIEKYCNNEKDNLISCGEVCEDILTIIDKLKGSDNNE